MSLAEIAASPTLWPDLLYSHSPEQPEPLLRLASDLMRLGEEGVELAWPRAAQVFMMLQQPGRARDMLQGRAGRLAQAQFWLARVQLARDGHDEYPVILRDMPRHLGACLSLADLEAQTRLHYALGMCLAKSGEAGEASRQLLLTQQYALSLGMTHMVNAALKTQINDIDLPRGAPRGGENAVELLASLQREHNSVLFDDMFHETTTTLARQRDIPMLARLGHIGEQQGLNSGWWPEALTALTQGTPAPPLKRAPRHPLMLGAHAMVGLRAMLVATGQLDRKEAMSAARRVLSLEVPESDVWPVMTVLVACAQARAKMILGDMPEAARGILALRVLRVRAIEPDEKPEQDLTPAERAERSREGAVRSLVGAAALCFAASLKGHSISHYSIGQAHHDLRVGLERDQQREAHASVIARFFPEAAAWASRHIVGRSEALATAFGREVLWVDDGGARFHYERVPKAPGGEALQTVRDGLDLRSSVTDGDRSYRSRWRLSMKMAGNPPVASAWSCERLSRRAASEAPQRPPGLLDTFKVP